MSKESILVDIELIDGTILKRCAIYNENPKNGQEGFTTYTEIEEAFDKSQIPWGHKYVAFQNELVNGHVHVNNVRDYSICEEND